MNGTIVGVLRGGPSREHEVSLATGAAIMANLDLKRYTVRDIYIDRAGVWHERGLPVLPEKALRTLDVAVIGLHGEYGEDGEVQKVLERFGIPYTGSDSFASFVAMHKVLSKEKAKEHGIKTARYVFIEEESDVDSMLAEVVRTYPQPVVVKPVRWGSSVGVSLVAGFAPLQSAVKSLLEQGTGGVLVEEYIRGVEATAGVVEGLRGEGLYHLPPIEIRPPAGAEFFDRQVKNSGETEEICPARFPRNIMEELSLHAATMHGALGLRHYSRSDFIVSPKGIYYLETNTLPGLTPQSLLPKSLAAVGMAFPDFLSYLIDLALQTKHRA